jgi:replicative DNA helicase
MREDEILMQGITNIMTDSVTEAQILATILTQKDSYYIIADKINEKMFYKLEHQLIYRSISDVANENKEIDTITILENAKTKGYFKIPGAQQLMVVLTSLPTDNVRSFMIEAHVQILQEVYQRRKLHMIASGVQSKCLDNNESNEIINYINNEIVDLTNINEEEFDPEKVVHQTMNDIENSDDKSFVKTGIQVLDDFIYGFQLTDFVVIGGAPSMGKTAFVIAIFLNMLLNKSHPAFFSLEMGKKQLITRLLAMLSEVSLSDIRKKAITQGQKEALRRKAHLLAKEKFLIDDKTGDLSQIINKIRKYNAKFGTKVFIIDYLQLVNIDLGKSSTREREIATISRSLKEVARTLEVIIIALSQLSREVGKRSDTRPKLSDLRESGAIEQDADFVIFPYRPAYYDNFETKIPFKERAELIIAKGRGTGITGMAQDDKLFIYFISSFTKYLNGDEQTQEDNTINF